jgi:hypothetical protein
MNHSIPSAPPILDLNEHVLMKSLILMQKKLQRTEYQIQELKDDSKILTENVKEKLDMLQAENIVLQKQNEELKNNDIRKCLLCMEMDRNVLFRPCNHLLICDTCSGNTNFTECIVCKHAISDYEYAYF